MVKCVSETCHKHLLKNLMSCQAVCNKMEIDPIPNELKDLKSLEKKKKSAASETVLVSEMPILSDKEIFIIIAPRQGKTPISLLHEDTCEELAFSYLIPNDKFGYSVLRDIPVSIVRHFNQRLLNFNKTFASYPDYISLARLCMNGIICSHQ